MLEKKEKTNVSMGLFVKLRKAYDDARTKVRNDLKRVCTISEMEKCGAFYSLLRNVAPDYPRSGVTQAARVFFFFPCLRHEDGGKTIGSVLKRYKPDKLDLMLRNDYPYDIEILKEACEIVGGSLDYRKFAPLVYFWNEENKERIMVDYYWERETPSEED